MEPLPKKRKKRLPSCEADRAAAGASGFFISSGRRGKARLALGHDAFQPELA
jgi:hypothetical protein